MLSFSIVSEMRDPRMYNRAMLISQAIITAVYIVSGMLYTGGSSTGDWHRSILLLWNLRCFSGARIGWRPDEAYQLRASPARTICHRYYLPARKYIHSESVVCTDRTQLPAKYIFLRIMKGSDHLTSNSVTHWSVWIACTFGCAMISYIIARCVHCYPSPCTSLIILQRYTRI